MATIEIPDEHPVAEALKIIGGDRQNDYGPPERNFQRIADVWSVILGIEVTPAQVGWCMVGVKMAREVNCPKRDNIVDAIGYAAIIGEIEYQAAQVAQEIQAVAGDAAIDITDRVMDELFAFGPYEWYRHKETGALWRYLGQFPEGNRKEDRKFVSTDHLLWWLSAREAMEMFVPAGGAPEAA